LEPLVQTFPNAGTLAKGIFAIGIIGMGLLGIPVLAGSASYAVSEAFGWSAGLDKRPNKARGFYAIIIISTLIGLGLTVIGVNPMKALVFAAVLNGVVAVPLIFLISRIARNSAIMGDMASGRLSRAALTTTFVVMLVCALALFVTMIG
jgi:Mn2+/Fe2+ NRAMP family transporter